MSLLASALAFAFGWSANRLRSYWKFRNIRYFWRDFVTDDLRVVTSIFIDAEHYRWERSGLIGVGDVLALNELEKQLQKAGLHHLPLTPSHQLTGPEYRGNLILVGGPHSNLVTAEVMRRLPLTLGFGDAETHDAKIYDSETQEITEYTIDGNDQLITDHGVLIRAANPFNPERNIIILAGSFGYGTSAVALMTGSPKLLSHNIVTAGHPFEAVVSAEIVRNTPQRIEMKKIKRLGFSPSGS
ncbi:hypothetical protein [Streptomyces niveus]|uniref:hypothetical protein n=1 Tax=Streptomyces niveus TaxID=193462 RepID=UPI0036D2187E